MNIQVMLLPASGTMRILLLLAWSCMQLTRELIEVVALSSSAVPPPRTSRPAEKDVNLAVPIFFDSSNALHRSLTYHPEQPARIEACVQALEEWDQKQQQPALATSANSTGGGTSSSGGRPIIRRNLDLVDVAAAAVATTANNDDDADGLGTTSSAAPPITSCGHPILPNELEYARDILMQVHAPEMVLKLERKCRESRRRRVEDGKPPLGFVGNIDDDTYVTTDTYDVCLRATATWIRAVDWVMEAVEKDPSSSRMVPSAMALTRPPGHHATATMSNGFCIFNFCAAAALHCSQKAATADNNNQPIIKISILDWDVHYGQGTADIVSNYPDTIRYASIHQVPAFPYMGTERKLSGNIMTIPMIADTTWTCGYRQYFHEALDFLFGSASSEDDDDGWEPDLVLVSAGYDALDSDDLASVSLNAQDFHQMTHAVLERIRNQTKPAGLVLGLEGGYQLGAMAGGGNLQQAVVETVKALLHQQENTEEK